MNVRSIVISSLQSCSQLFWGMHTHSFQTNQNHPHMEGYFKYYQTLNPKVQRPPRLVVCVHHSKQLQRRRFKSWNTINQTSIYIPYCFQSAIVGKGGNVGWECVDPCGGIKPKSWMVVKEDAMDATYFLYCAWFMCVQLNKSFGGFRNRAAIFFKSCIWNQIESNRAYNTLSIFTNNTQRLMIFKLYK